MQGAQTGPRSFGQVMDAAFSIYLRQFWPLVKISAAVLLPLIVLTYLLDIYRFSEVDGGELYILGDSVRRLDEGRIIQVGIAIAVINVIGYLLVVGASLRGASEAYLGNDVDTGSSIRFAARKLGSMFWLALLFVLIVGLSIFLFVLPAIWLSILWIFSMPALLFEGRKGFKAFGRSRELIKGFWWRTFGVVILIGIFTGLLGDVIPGAIVGALESSIGDDVNLYLLALTVFTGIGTIITAPIWAAAVTVMYYDMRVRKEGFDVEVMVDRLGAGDESGFASPQQSVPPGSPAPGLAPPAPPVDTGRSEPPPGGGPTPGT
jgi:hypothetical protein